jgi:hypothetical protein
MSVSRRVQTICSFKGDQNVEKTKLLLVIVVGLAVMLGGCAKKAQETGFLSTYKNLEPVSSDVMRYISPEVGQYSKFIIDPITVKFYDKETAEKVEPNDVKHLEEFLYAEILKDKPEQYQIVSTPGPGVARIRIAITNLKKSEPALNVLPQTKLTGLGLGQASVEMEAVNSMTDVQLAAAIISQTGSRFSLSGLSKWGDVEAVMKDWAKRIWLRIDEAHGIQK